MAAFNQIMIGTPNRLAIRLPRIWTNK